MHGDFFLLEHDNEPGKRAERLAFGETSGRNEAWLRDTLFDYPELLPINEIDPAFGPLIPLCKELRTEAGPVDIAFINPHGCLTLVECKLWRNPESRRKVVAQVLDYARSISRWSYSDLQRQVSAATCRKGNVPFDLACAAQSNLSEHRFVDAATAAIRSGRFLLLIAGDGIREDVGGITELINRNSALGFVFGQVEIGLYGLEDGGLIVQPRVIAKTKTIERTVVLVRDSNSSTVEIVDADDDGQPAKITSPTNELGESPKQAEYRAWWKDVTDMVFDDPDQESPKLYWPNNVRTPLPFPKTWLTAYRYSDNVGISTAGSGQSYEDMINKLFEHADEILLELPPGAAFVKDSDGRFVFRLTRKASDFQSEDEKRQWLCDSLNQYVNALRPRL